MKRVTTFIVALVFTVGLTACGGEKSPAPEQPPLAENSTENQNQATGEEDNAPGQDPAMDSSTESQSELADDPDKETKALLDSITADNAEFKGVCGDNAMWYYKDNVLVIKCC